MIQVQGAGGGITAMSILDIDEKWKDLNNEKNKGSRGVEFLNEDEGKFFQEGDRGTKWEEKKKGVYCQAENFKYVILEKPPFSTVKVIQISLFDEGN